MFINNAYAASAGSPLDFMSFAPMIVIFVLFWFMLIRPQMKQAKDQRNMIAALQKGDEVATAAGIVGKVTKVSNDFIALEIATGVTVNVQKHTVQTLLPKGTIKTL